MSADEDPEIYALALYLGTDGKMGECPDWYADMQAAKYLGCLPWDLPDQADFWRDSALKAMTAEVRGQEIKQRRGQ